MGKDEEMLEEIGEIALKVPRFDYERLESKLHNLMLERLRIEGYKESARTIERMVG